MASLPSFIRSSRLQLLAKTTNGVLAAPRSETRSRAPLTTCVKIHGVSRSDDDEDWVGTPPEGRYTRDRAKPEFWWRQRPIVPAATGIAIVVVVIVVVVLLG
jgi:hypothetical protein